MVLFSTDNWTLNAGAFFSTSTRSTLRTVRPIDTSAFLRGIRFSDRTNSSIAFGDAKRRSSSMYCESALEFCCALGLKPILAFIHWTYLSGACMVVPCYHQTD